MSSYIGTQSSYGLFEKQTITILQDVTEYTLNHRVSVPSSILVICDRLVLEPGIDYSISYTNATSKLSLSSSLNLSEFDGDTTNATKVYVLYLGKEITVPNSYLLLNKIAELEDRIEALENSGGV